jgi:hypothetical protein
MFLLNHYRQIGKTSEMSDLVPEAKIFPAEISDSQVTSPTASANQSAADSSTVFGGVPRL